MRALRQRCGQHPGCRPRGRPARHPIPRELGRASLRRLASANRLRADRAEQENSDLQRRFDAQARELAEARARIAELERLLAEARGAQEDRATDEGHRPAGTRPDPAQPESRDEGAAQPADGQAGGSGGSGGQPSPRPPRAQPRPGIGEVRMQLSQTLQINAELRALLEELQLRIATLERRCAELEQQLQRALAISEPSGPTAGDQTRNPDSLTPDQSRAAILSSELEQVRRERNELAAQRERLASRLAAMGLSTSADGTITAAAFDGRTVCPELYAQICIELRVRDEYARLEADHRDRVTDWLLDPNRTLEEQAQALTQAMMWLLMAHTPQSLRHCPRWEILGQRLDRESERFVIHQSQERVAYRQRWIERWRCAVA